MKKRLLFPAMAMFLAVGCGEQQDQVIESDENETEAITESELQTLEADRAVNIELEQLDGELDSLLNTL
jgi:cytochrome oxidase Cu insertion factor (SCO1/SenC/PrrC family)